MLARRRRWFALAGSLLVHALLALIILRVDLRSLVLPKKPMPREIVTIVERLSIARRTRERRPAPLHPRVRREPPHERAAIATAAPAPKRAIKPKTLALHPTHHELAKIIPQRAPILPPPAAPAAETQPQLSDARIASIQDSLRAAIANDRNGRDPLAVPSAAAVEAKHYGLDASNFSQGDRNHHGLCDPVKDWTEGDFNYYYVACNVRFSDGTYERQAVPWPVRFAPADDPFAGTSRTGEKPLALPLPGWRLPPGATISVELRQYARGHGVDF